MPLLEDLALSPANRGRKPITILRELLQSGVLTYEDLYRLTMEAEVILMAEDMLEGIEWPPADESRPTFDLGLSAEELTIRIAAITMNLIRASAGLEAIRQYQ